MTAMPDPALKDRAERVAATLALDAKRVYSALQLFEGGATVPFIARYRKDQTGKLDEVALRDIQEESGKAKALEERKAQVLASLEERGLLVSELRTSIEQAPTKAALEDLYAPYKTARKTRASQAIEKGLLPLAERLIDPREMGEPEALAAPFVSAEKGVATVAEALEGASDIIREKIATDAPAREKVRDAFWERGKLVVAAARGKKQ